MLPFAARHARRASVRALALELMDRHGLHGWGFAFNRRKRAMGLCRFTARVIEVSVYLVDRNDLGEVRDTLLHEIAHALVGHGHGHDAVWKAKCREIGAVPERCRQADMPRGRWRAQCPACAALFTRHRRPKQARGWYCRACGPERGPLAWGEVI
jgi:predicted SprT family Zn-dependent metalloprotease